MAVVRRSSGERTFLYYWSALSGQAPPPGEQHRFHPTRKWRFDFAWADKMLAVEVDGGTWLSKHGKKGGHNTGVGFQKDCEKYNAAIMLGWRVLRYTPTMLKNDPQKCIDEILQALK